VPVSERLEQGSKAVSSLFILY